MVDPRQSLPDTARDPAARRALADHSSPRFRDALPLSDGAHAAGDGATRHLKLPAHGE